MPLIRCWRASSRLLALATAQSCRRCGLPNPWRKAKKQAKREAQDQAAAEQAKADAVRTPQPVESSASDLSKPAATPVAAASQVPPASVVSGWTVQEVCDFIAAHKRILARCRAAFEENDIDGELFLQLGADELDEIGITSSLQRKAILSVIEKIEAQ